MKHFGCQIAGRFLAVYLPVDVAIDWRLEGVVDRDMNPRPIWKEVGEFARELKELAPVFLTMKPAPNNISGSTNTVLIRSFEGPRNTRYVLLVNLDVLNSATFRGTVADLGDDMGIWDVRTGAAIEIESGSPEDGSRFTVSIEPGDGALLRLGL